MKKTIGFGEDDFQTFIQEKHFFIDKTLFIKEFLESDAKVTMITRPNGFGKTLNMSMLANFLDITKNSKFLFEDKNIMQTALAHEMNQYPVIFVSFKNVKGEKENAIKALKRALFDEYKRFDFIYHYLSENSKEEYTTVWESLKKQNSIELSDIIDCLQLLCQFLYEYYGKKVILLINGYDTPFTEAYCYEYYNEICSGLAIFLETSLKGNEYLKKAMLMGVVQTGKGNVFSGLNNISVYGVNHEKYAPYFGFTEEETKMFLEYFDLALTKEITKLYSGYRIGEIKIYSPYSISKYANEKRFDIYRKDNICNKVDKAFDKHSMIFSMKYHELIESGETVVYTDLNVSYGEDMNDSTLWAYMIHYGYLTIKEIMERGVYKVIIPNEEVRQKLKNIPI